MVNLASNRKGEDERRNSSDGSYFVALPAMFDPYFEWIDRQVTRYTG